MGNTIFENLLEYEFNKIWSYCKSDSNREWTLAVKSILVKINDKFFYKKIGASGLNVSDSGEWLLDFIIYEEDSILNFLNKILLAAEIEWRNYGEYFTQIKYDFEKLLIVKAQYKLFIFEVESEEEQTDYCLQLSKIFLNYNDYNNSDDELFYLVIWNRIQQKFILKKIS